MWILRGKSFRDNRNWYWPILAITSEAIKLHQHLTHCKKVFFSLQIFWGANNVFLMSIVTSNQGKPKKCQPWSKHFKKMYKKTIPFFVVLYRIYWFFQGIFIIFTLKKLFPQFWTQKAENHRTCWHPHITTSYKISSRNKKKVMAIYNLKSWW